MQFILRRKTAPILLIALFCCLSFKASSQNKNFKKWSVSEGLPSSTIYCIEQDQNGNIWLGTPNGACLFDGKKFKTFTKKDGLAGNEVRCILKDSSGKLWFGTNEGISIFNYKTIKNIQKKNGLSGSTILCLLEDNNKNIWAGSDNAGINIISTKADGGFSINTINTDDGLSSNQVFDLYQDKEQLIWIATLGGGINLAKQNKNSFTINTIKGKENIPSDLLISISKDKQDNLWFGTYKEGAFKISKTANEQNQDLTKVICYDGILDSNAVWDIITTQKGDTWFGTFDNGIYRIPFENESVEESIETYKKEQGISGNQVLSLFEDREKNVWIGTSGDGLSMFRGDHFAHFNASDGLPENKIQSIKQDKDGKIWIASAGGGIAKIDFTRQKPLINIYDEKSGFPSNFTTSIAFGNNFNGNTWIATSNKGIIKLDEKKYSVLRQKDDLIKDIVNTIMIDSKGIVWYGTANGISRFDGTNFENISAENMKMNNQGVNSIIEDKAGNIWFGAMGGLARYSKGKILRTFDEVEGLFDINVNTIAEDQLGNIWIGTNEGRIFKYNKNKPDSNAIEFIADENTLGSNSISSLLFYDANTLIAGGNKGFDRISLNKAGKIIAVKQYNASDGFIGIECNNNSICKDNKGNIWFGTVNGLTRYSPLFEKTETILPNIQLTSIQLFFKDVNWANRADKVAKWNNIPEQLVLPYNENHLTFHFSGISFINPEKIKYQYFLEGNDKEWSPISSTDFVTFSGISKGNYTFKVVAIDANGKASLPALFHFTINPPWYETKLFYATCLTLIIIVVYSFIKYREKKLLLEKALLEKTVKERTHEIELQKKEIGEKNQEITDSINSAQLIQLSILPNRNEVKKYLPNSFILYKPKDIVSGDFYWFKKGMEKAKQKIFIAAADCTGHGVPGAFMSTIGVEKLNDAVKNYDEPGEILSFVNLNLKNSLRQSQEENNNEPATNHGMDIALLRFDFSTENAELLYSGANRPLWLCKKNAVEIEEIKANKKAIGGHTDDDQIFDTHLLHLTTGDTIYVCSDGFADQFGGTEDKKLQTKKFKEILMQIQSQTMEEQHLFLDNYIDNWKGKTEQTDDILVIGIRV